MPVFVKILVTCLTVILMAVLIAENSEDARLEQLAQAAGVAALCGIPLTLLAWVWST